tara:strand:+ start:1019 stop:1903 length:885 start_codon:yes stop_codon:yes gene_type:complete
MADKQNKIYYQEGEDTSLNPGVPVYENASYEKVIQNKNSYIVLGKDRPSGPNSGRSLESHAHSIDLVVGRKGKNIEKVGPQFKEDAARIFISEKTDVDDWLYFDLRNNSADGGLGNPTSKSAIGIKADSVRIIGREGVKIVTGTDLINSKDAPIISISGIDLCAGNYRGASMQPLIKGENMVDCVNRLLNYVSTLQNTVMEFINYQMAINAEQSKANASIQTHVHATVVGPTTPAPLLQGTIPVVQASQAAATIGLATKAAGLPNEVANVTATRYKYLNPSSNKYICSSYNNTN